MANANAKWKANEMRTVLLHMERMIHAYEKGLLKELDVVPVFECVRKLIETSPEMRPGADIRFKVRFRKPNRTFYVRAHDPMTAFEIAKMIERVVEKPFSGKGRTLESAIIDSLQNESDD